MLAPLVAALAVIPIVALAPVLNSMFGADSQFGRQAVAALAAFVPVFVNTLRGLRQTRPVHRDLMQAYAATRAPDLPHRHAADRGCRSVHRPAHRVVARRDLRPRRRVLRRAARRPRRASSRPRPRRAPTPARGPTSSAAIVLGLVFYLVDARCSERLVARHAPGRRHHDRRTTRPAPPNAHPIGTITRTTQHTTKGTEHETQHTSQSRPGAHRTLSAALALAACSGSGDTADGSAERLGRRRAHPGQAAAAVAAAGAVRRLLRRRRPGLLRGGGPDVEIIPSGGDIVPQDALANGDVDYAIAWVPKVLGSIEARRRAHRHRADLPELGHPPGLVGGLRHRRPSPTSRARRSARGASATSGRSSRPWPRRASTPRPSRSSRRTST